MSSHYRGGRGEGSSRGNPRGNPRGGGRGRYESDTRTGRSGTSGHGGRSESATRSGRSESASRSGRHDPAGRGGRYETTGQSSRGGRHESHGSSEPSDSMPMYQDAAQPKDAYEELENEVIKRHKNIAQKPRELVRRPAYGTLGRPVILRANFFQVSFNKKTNFYCYRVVIKPEPSVKRLTKEIFRQIMDMDQMIRNHAASDNATEIVALRPLELQPRDFTFGGNGGSEGKTFRVSLEEEKVIDVDALVGTLQDPTKGLPESATVAIRAFNILMTGAPSRNSHVAIVGKGRSKFFWTHNREQINNLQGGLECIRGFYSSMRLAAGRVLMNLNVNHSAFYRPIKLSQVILEFSDVFGPDPNVLNRYLRGVRVELIHLPPEKRDNGTTALRQKSIWGLASPRDGQGPHRPRVEKLGAGADKVQFFFENRGTDKGHYVSVAEYYKQTYKKKLQYESMPVVNVGSSTKPVYLPAEVCVVLPGQVYNGELGTTQRQNMIRSSCRTPERNYMSIMSEGRRILGIEDGTFSKYGMDIQPDMVAVRGRILNAPTLKYGSAKQSPRFGSWNLISKKFCQGASIPPWTGVLLRQRGVNSRDDNVGKALNGFWQHGKNLGISWPQPDQYLTVSYDRGSMYAEIDRMFQTVLQRRYAFIVVLLPIQEDRVFNYIKWIGDTKAGILTHCCFAGKFCNGQEQYFANNAMKVNLKMGGVCQTLDTTPSSRLLSAGKTMVVGLDVTHPSLGDAESFPSISCIVASIDSRIGQWPGEACVQARRTEDVSPLQSMMIHRLERWKTQNKVLPQNILVYRDGVSEGQYQMVVENELRSIKDAAQAMYKGTQPNITIVVCGKRHNVRFYPTKRIEADKTHNPINGTIVDRGITLPLLWDFYLQSQCPLQGSARPAHYIVVHDEIFTNANANPDYTKPVDSLQELTHNICYMMGRCTRSISYATPAFLADKFCDRARRYVRAYYNREVDTHERGFVVEKPTADVVRLAARISESMVYI